jgi:hypothetical protein
MGRPSNGPPFFVAVFFNCRARVILNVFQDDEKRVGGQGSLA